MRTLVTGGAGFIGSHLVDRIATEDGNEVIILDNFSTGRHDNLASSISRIQLIEGDIRDRGLLKRIMTDIELVYHLAAQSNVLGAELDLDYSFNTNVVGTYEVLRAAAAASVRRVVFTSSREIYGEPGSLPVAESAPIAPKNAYGASKASAEMYCRSFSAQGLDVVVLRLANVYGPRDRGRVIPLFTELALNGEPLTVFGPDKTLDFVWIENVIDALVEAARCATLATPINVGSGKGITLTELAQRISVLAGNQASVTVVENRKSDVSRFVADVTAGRNLLNLQCPSDPIEHLPLIVHSLANGTRWHAVGV